MSQDSFVDEALLSRIKTWRNYFAAKLGFRNHWYAACFADEIPEGETIARKILGEDIIFRRIKGRVHAMKDRCIHRGVRFSEKVECHTPGTISCWYHGFTYRWDDGVLCNIVGAPNSALIGIRINHAGITPGASARVASATALAAPTIASCHNVRRKASSANAGCGSSIESKRCMTTLR